MIIRMIAILIAMYGNILVGENATAEGVVYDCSANWNVIYVCELSVIAASLLGLFFLKTYKTCHQPDSNVRYTPIQ
jgi:hypothetical protein